MFGTPGVAEHRGRSGLLYRCLGGAQELEGSLYRTPVCAEHRGRGAPLYRCLGGAQEGKDPCTELREVLSTEGGEHPCRDSREELENGTDLRRGKPDTQSWVDSRNNNRGELLRTGCPCTEPQGERGPEGGTDPYTGIWGVSLVDEGASTAILRKAGTDGGMGPCTDSWRELSDVGGSGTDTEERMGAEGGADSCADHRGESENRAGPCTDIPGMPVSRLESGAAPSVVLKRLADMGIRWLGPWALKSQRPIL